MEKIVEEYIKYKEEKAVKKYKETQPSYINNILIVLLILGFLYIANNNTKPIESSPNITINE